MRSLLAMVLAYSVTTAEPVTIPLKDIWAYGMPGTRSVGRLDSGKAGVELVVPLRKAIKDRWRNDFGFAVPGEGLEALRQFHRIKATNGKTVPLTEGMPNSLVFFTDFSASYVHISRVERQGNAFTIFYQFVPHETREMTQHFALIPVGILSAGKYTVRIERLPISSSLRDTGFKEPAEDYGAKVVSRPFNFIVEKQRR